MISIDKKNLSFLGAGLALGFFAFYFTCSSKNPLDNNIKETRFKQNYKYINPLLECDNGNSISRDKNLNSLKKNINAYINEEISKNEISFASVYYRDLNNGPWFGVNEREYFSPASLIKVPLLMAYMKLSESDSSLFSKKIINTEKFNPAEQNFQPAEHLEENKEYTIEDLLKRMIIYSDNLAYKLLLKNIDNGLVFNIYNDLGVDISKAVQDPNGNIITVKDYASFYRILFNSSYLSKDTSEKTLELLSMSEFNQGITARIPKEIKVSHKFGERKYLETGEKQLHDCGVVYAPEKPYLICIMTRGSSFEKAANTISTISNKVYDGINQNK